MSFDKTKGGRLEVVRNFRATSSFNDEAIFNFLHSLDTPKSLAVWLLYKSGEHDQLLQLSCTATHYLTASAFRLDYCAISFLSKATFLKTSFNKKAVALEKFELFESLCRRTNLRFRNLNFDPLYRGSNVWLLSATTRKIAQILGDFSGEEFVLEAGWGPGVSTLLKGEEVSAFNKFRDERGITRDLYSLVSPWFEQAYPGWSSIISAHSEHDSGFLFQVGNSIVTVPKNSKTDRVIAIEPGINLWFQKSIGKMIRRRLQRVGVDLDSQVRNQQLSRKGSKDLSLATVDFSSASDSISSEVVRALLPPRWFSLLDTCRSKIGTNDSCRIWNKFSSMGNGFTFELESLIFYASAQAVCELHNFPCNEISVFGDDVIIPNTAFEPYSEFCEFLGFIVNPNKSFYSGCFRESCGAHWYSGVDCKPIFLKERINYVESFYKLANNVRSLAHRYSNYRYCDERFLGCWCHLFEGVPELLQLIVPRQAGDTGFIGNFDEARPTRARGGIEGYYYNALISQGVTLDSDHRAMLQARLWQQSRSAPSFPLLPRFLGLTEKISRFGFMDTVRQLQSRERSDLMYRNTYTLRGRSKRKISRSFCFQWYNLGEWCT